MKHPDDPNLTEHAARLLTGFRVTPAELPQVAAAERDADLPQGILGPLREGWDAAAQAQQGGQS